MQIGRDIIQACIHGDRKAQHHMYTSCFSFMMSICYRYTNSKDDALAMVNLGFLKVLNHLQQYKEEIPIEVWIRKIMVNTVIDEFRRQKRHSESISLRDAFTQEEEQTMIDTGEADKKIDAAQIRSYIAQLPNVTGKVFNLFAIDGYSHKEIAEMLGMSEGTSKWHLSDARQKLKAMITAAVKHVRLMML